MYLYVEEVGFTSFYVFVGLGYRFDLFLCICVLMISVLPFSMCLCVEIEQGKTVSSTLKYIEKGKTDILNTQIHRKR
jgi:hypothetical protein